MSLGYMIWLFCGYKFPMINVCTFALVQFELLLLCSGHSSKLLYSVPFVTFLFLYVCMHACTHTYYIYTQINT
jgi:hypothetical protein